MKAAILIALRIALRIDLYRVVTRINSYVYGKGQWISMHKCYVQCLKVTCIGCICNAKFLYDCMFADEFLLHLWSL